MKKGIHPENYRPVVFKSTQVRASSLTQQDVLISS